MKICSLSSGSSGNCIYLESKNSKILIDAGLSGKKTKIALDKIGINIGEIDFILLSHEHTDHVKGAGILSRRYNIPIYANEKTWIGMREKIGKIKEENINIIETDKALSIRDLYIKGFSIYHDALDPLGFSFYQDNKKISILTDTGKYNDRILNEIKDSNIYYLEANYDEEMLWTGSYSYQSKLRIHSEKGHLSNIDASNILLSSLKGNNEKVILAHLSIENNRPELAREVVGNSLLENGLDIYKDIELSVAKRYEPSKLFDLDK